MAEKLNDLMREQLAAAMRPFRSRAAAQPRAGWLRAVREAIGMTQAQAGARIRISRQSVQDFEEAEVKRRITLESLDRMAEALGCRLVYALVPRSGTLEDLRKRQAEKVARELLERTDHSMKLEAQGVTDAERERQRKRLASDLLRGSSRKLWK